MELDWSIIPEYWDAFMQGAQLTILIAVVSITLGFFGGILIGMGRLSKNPIAYYATTVYVEAFRGTPLLIQIFLIYLGVPYALDVQFDPLYAGIIALSLNSAAYQGEIFRGGIQSIPKGQMEAARSMGLTKGQTMRNVLLPQGLRNALPTYTNEFCTMIKDSSLCSVIGVTELTQTGQDVFSVTFQPFVIYIFIALLYFVMTFITSKSMRFIERKYAVPGMMGGD